MMSEPSTVPDVCVVTAESADALLCGEGITFSAGILSGGIWAAGDCVLSGPLVEGPVVVLPGVDGELVCAIATGANPIIRPKTPMLAAVFGFITISSAIWCASFARCLETAMARGGFRRVHAVLCSLFE